VFAANIGERERNLYTNVIITYTKEDMQSSLFVCLLATLGLRENFWTDLHEIFREGWNGPVNSG